MDLTRKGQERFLVNYRDHVLEISNGTLMRVGVCQNCKELLVAGKKVKKTAEDILENCKAFWRGSDEYAPHGFEMFEVIDPNTDEDKFALKRKNKNLEEGEKLQAQKDYFAENHDIEEKRIEKELKIKRDKEKEKHEKFVKDVEERAEKEKKIKDKSEKEREEEEKKLITNFGLL
jgi:hypothetical protein